MVTSVRTASQTKSFDNFSSLLSKLQINLNYLFLHRQREAGKIERISDTDTYLFNSLREQFNNVICATPSASQADPIMINVGEIKNEIDRLSKYYESLIADLHRFETEIENKQQGGAANKVREYIEEIKSRLSGISVLKESLDSFEDTAYHANEELGSHRHQAVLAVLKNLKDNERSITDSIRSKIKEMKPAQIHPDEVTQKMSADTFNSKKAELLNKIDDYLRADESNRGEQSKISSYYLDKLQSKNDLEGEFNGSLGTNNLADSCFFNQKSGGNIMSSDSSLVGGGFSGGF